MYRIMRKEEIAPLTYMMLIDAPIIAKKSKMWAICHTKN